VRGAQTLGLIGEPPSMMHGCLALRRDLDNTRVSGDVAELRALTALTDL
jgi:hypothetical protein